eukprot:10636266-Ditylum_brightwellii.AAC.1
MEYSMGDDELPLLIPQDGSYTLDPLIPTQIISKKTKKAQHKINNAKHCGHSLTTKDDNTLHMYFQNVNRVATKEDLRRYMEEMHERDADIWGWAETNVNWTPHMVSKAKYMENQIYNTFTFVASLSEGPAGFYWQDNCVPAPLPAPPHPGPTY